MPKMSLCKTGPGKCFTYCRTALRKAFCYRITIIELYGKVFFICLCHTHIYSKRTGDIIFHGNAKRTAIVFHANPFCQKMYRPGEIPLQRKLIQKKHQPADSVFTLLRAAAVGSDTLCLDLHTIFCPCTGDLFCRHGHNFLCRFFRAQKPGTGMGRHNIVRHSSR